jgi:hypothetical protein
LVDIIGFGKFRKNHFELRVYIFMVFWMRKLKRVSEIGSSFLFKNLEQGVYLTCARKSMLQINKLIGHDSYRPIVDSKSIVRVS